MNLTCPFYIRAGPRGVCILKLKKKQKTKKKTDVEFKIVTF